MRVLGAVRFARGRGLWDRIVGSPGLGGVISIGCILEGTLASDDGRLRVDTRRHLGVLGVNLLEGVVLRLEQWRKGLSALTEVYSTEAIVQEWLVVACWPRARVAMLCL